MDAAEKAEQYRSEYENKVGELQMSMMLTDMHRFIYRFMALYARSLVTVYVFYVSLQYVNVVSSVMCAFALMDCAFRPSPLALALNRML